MALRLIAGTTNAAKAWRLRALCAGLDVNWVSTASTADAPDVDETGDSHIANAVRKAVAWSRAYAAAALASDGGLAIPALGEGWQSLLTRRATGGDVSDEEHAARLLRRMQSLQGTRREAYWTEAVAVARNGALIQAWEAMGLRGLIAEDYRPPPTGPGGSGRAACGRRTTASVTGSCPRPASPRRKIRGPSSQPQCADY